MTDVVQPQTASVDFKVQPCVFDADAEDVTVEILQWPTSGDNAGHLFIELTVEGDPVVRWENVAGTGVYFVENLTNNIWYTVEWRLGWDGNLNVNIYERESTITLVNHTEVLVDAELVAYVKAFAGFIGTDEVTSEVMIDNVQLQIHCNDNLTGT